MRIRAELLNDACCPPTVLELKFIKMNIEFFLESALGLQETRKGGKH